MLFEPDIMLHSRTQKLEHWFDQQVGQMLLAQQQALLDDWLETLFGYHLLQLSVCSKHKLFNYSKIKHKFCLSEQLQSQHAVSDFENLPLLSESVDVVLLHHVLESTQNPHALLRAAARVTMPGGYIIVLGFNPYSAFAVANPTASFSLPERFSASRISDWLNLLEFSTPTSRFGFYRLPFKRFCQSNETPWYFRYPEKKQWPIGGFYGLLARKQPVTVTPIKPKRLPPALGLAVKPSICKDLKHHHRYDTKQ